MKKNGFTLIELIIVVALLSVLVAVSAFVFLIGLKAWSSGLDRTAVRADGRMAIERMVRDLSQAGPITDARDDTITFTADVDNDSVNETVTFSLSGNNLVMTVDDAALNLIPDAQTLVFSYIDKNNDSFVPHSPADRDMIRVVTVELTVNKANETYTLSSSAYTRNQIL